MDEQERWFHREQDRQRERRMRAERAKRRIARAAKREELKATAFNPPGTRMQVTEWSTDEQGNLSRKIYAE